MRNDSRRTATVVIERVCVLFLVIYEKKALLLKRKKRQMGYTCLDCFRIL